MTIHLCGRPGSVHGRTALSLRDLAPGGVCRAAPVARDAGALLPHRFTLTARRRRSVFCGTFLRVTSTGASQHPVLRSPDFPQPRRAAVIQSAPRHHPLFPGGNGPQHLQCVHHMYIERSGRLGRPQKREIPPATVVGYGRRRSRLDVDQSRGGPARDHVAHRLPVHRRRRPPAYKFGRVIRIQRGDVDAFIEASRVKPGALTHLHPRLDEGT